MPYHTPFPSFPLHVKNQSVPVAQQSIPTDNDPARQNNPASALPFVGGPTIQPQRSMMGGFPDYGYGRSIVEESQMGAFPDTLAAVTMNQGIGGTMMGGGMSMIGGRCMMGMSPQTIYPSMVGSPPPMSHHHHHHTMNGQFSPPPFASSRSPVPRHHTMNGQFSPPPFASSRSPIQQHSMIVLPNRTIHQTYGSVVMPQDPAHQVYNDLPVDARAMQGEMVYNQSMPNQEAPGQLKTMGELAVQNASNRSYAYGMQQYGPVSLRCHFSFSTSHGAKQVAPQFPFRPEGCEQLNKLNTYVSVFISSSF